MLLKALFKHTATLSGLIWIALANLQSSEELQLCGEANYNPNKYNCYENDFLCPILNGQLTLRCGSDCYNPEMYSCRDGELIYSALPASTACAEQPTTQWLSDPPYENYFYSDCHSASQVVVTSPLQGSNLSIIGPRLLVAWPAGNSGIVNYFEPQNGVNGTLSISLRNGSTGDSFPLHGIFHDSTSSGEPPFVGISTLIEFNSSAVLNVAILGSVRNIRDFTEGPSILEPVIQDGIVFEEIEEEGGVRLERLWLDNVTRTKITFSPTGDGSLALGTDVKGNRTIQFDAGTYDFTAIFNYPQLTRLPARKLLNAQSQDLITQEPDQTTSLSFLSYSTKLLAGAWRFLTYFGRDSMIATLLLQPVLSKEAIEAVIAAVLERLNRTSGVVCHEETIGDYATFLNLKDNVTSTKPGCTYIMVDTDFYLAPLMERYFLQTPAGRNRRRGFFNTRASLDFGNAGMSYGDLALVNAEGIMNRTSAFARPGGQAKENLIHLEEEQLVGQWRDSTYGIGGGRIPYDVNTALVPTALRSISALAAAGFFPEYPDWAQTAADRAKVWEDQTLGFFEVAVPMDEARDLVQNYTEAAGYGFPSHTEDIASDVVFHGLALDGNNDQSIVKVMNTDSCFRLFLLNTTNDTSFLNQTATQILSPFPVGLSSPAGLLIANPAYGGDPVYAANWTRNAYHGTVVWSW